MREGVVCVREGVMGGCGVCEGGCGGVFTFIPGETRAGGDDECLKEQ